jgi:glycosyltransferase involved in cell wall biosynthesis
MTRIRILHLVARSYRRGAEIAALELAHELDVLGHDNRVAALLPAFDGGSDPDLPEITRRAGTGLLDLAASAMRTRQLLRREPVDVVIAHGGWPVQVATLARWGNRPVVVWQRILGFPPGFWDRARHRWWAFVARRADAAVALTDDLADELRRLGFRGPVWVIANSRRPERFSAIDRQRAGPALRCALGIDLDVPLLGFVGHLVEQKRPQLAVDVLARVRARGVPAELVVAGDGPLRREVESRARALGLDDVVHLVGHRHDVEHVYGGLDVLLLTSEVEGIPGVTIEAQMTGCPVVTFPLGDGVRSVVEDGRTGVVLDSEDVDAMTDAVVSLLTDHERRHRLGDAARRASSSLSTRSAAQEYSARLTSLLRAT